MKGLGRERGTPRSKIKGEEKPREKQWKPEIAELHVWSSAKAEFKQEYISKTKEFFFPFSDKNEENLSRPSVNSKEAGFSQEENGKCEIHKGKKNKGSSKYKWTFSQKEMKMYDEI